MAINRADIESNDDTALERYQALTPGLAKKIDWFKDQKIGVIFHWGLYSEAGIVESWQLSAEDEWARKKPWRDDLDVLRQDYWRLNQQFNPLQFDATAWAQQIKAAGFNYMLFTTKHHDGFTMYDTQQTDYKMTASDCPYAVQPTADVFKALATAFKKEQLAVGAYYSKADWHHPAYWVPGSEPRGRYASYDPLKQPALWQKFNDFVAAQLTELCQNYGELDILWLDGGWVNRANNEQLDMTTLVPQLRQLQPNLLVVDRTIGGAFENYVTPERQIPTELPLKAWESNIPFAKNWGYVPNDTYKSFAELLETLVKIVALGGNVIFGIGPKPDGSLPLEAQQLLSEFGAWLKRFGDGIYGTRPFNIKALDPWYFTQKENKVFAFLLPQPTATSLTLADLQLNSPLSQCLVTDTGESLCIIKGQVTLPAATSITALTLLLESEVSYVPVSN
ncbi:alpha-L-fucosidase [Brochothrix campestris]|uniref:alpha-L-fucosidase n=1 Tax=Brochothrix campestris FSL F6-1037 TaxID=1265861 RepID=W7D230_9LIST|nr:alpha-L-fucosidase [Brochothrix campestris]EUJ42001.1 alpha-L-fucosidase [Brochothrix campestris FSL F6-1037]